MYQGHLLKTNKVLACYFSKINFGRLVPMALSNSVDSFREPYDISTAVSRALRLSSSNRTDADVDCPARCGPAYRLTAYDGGNASKRPKCYSAPDFHTNCFETSFEDAQLEMEVEAWSSDTKSRGGDMFCRYLDNESSPESSPEKYSPLTGWRVRLENDQLWKQFDSIGTEMVITKNGRRIFPALSLTISELDPTAIYSVAMDMVPTDKRRYKFLQSEWLPVGRAEKKQLYKQYIHPDSPSRGSFWMDNPVSFKLLKLTNNKNTKYSDQIILNSMQKYRPWITITCERDGVRQTYSFPETDFIAVTAYQNSQITQLKIENNPYARAFRECVPSTDGNTPERKGGHYLLREQQQKRKPRSSSKRKSTPSSSTSSGSSRNSPASSPAHPLYHTNPSATSVESGFESGTSDSTGSPFFPEPQLLPQVGHTGFESGMRDCTENPFFPEPQLFPQVAYGCPLNYWADDNSLYNPALITPPPQLDSTSSFSLPYLQQSSRMALESSYSIVSPLKGRGANETLFLDVETIEDDVFW